MTENRSVDLGRVHRALVEGSADWSVSIARVQRALVLVDRWWSSVGNGRSVAVGGVHCGGGRLPWSQKDLSSEIDEGNAQRSSGGSGKKEAGGGLWDQEVKGRRQVEG